MPLFAQQHLIRRLIKFVLKMYTPWCYLHTHREREKDLMINLWHFTFNIHDIINKPCMESTTINSSSGWICFFSSSFHFIFFKIIYIISGILAAKMLYIFIKWKNVFPCKTRSCKSEHVLLTVARTFFFTREDFYLFFAKIFDSMHFCSASVIWDSFTQLHSHSHLI